MTDETSLFDFIPSVLRNPISGKVSVWMNQQTNESVTSTAKHIEAKISKNRVIDFACEIHMINEIFDKDQRRKTSKRTWQKCRPPTKHHFNFKIVLQSMVFRHVFAIIFIIFSLCLAFLFVPFALFYTFPDFGIEIENRKTWGIIKNSLFTFGGKWLITEIRCSFFDFGFPSK